MSSGKRRTPHRTRAGVVGAVMAAAGLGLTGYGWSTSLLTLGGKAVLVLVGLALVHQGLSRLLRVLLGRSVDLTLMLSVARLIGLLLLALMAPLLPARRAQ
ncbi:hypothetical protein [Nocardioides sp. B-3]|uniref:hypothetical protein n=1 Tax=Nocardioides sp. B-3 TaxID=2895565 RepID=UPI002153158D|nr:hypothetical protein [Nocardioides sp. B-3]UUZ59408.1 hypothetical protein LP418_27005 [Nocardioides sp. B-3]